MRVPGQKSLKLLLGKSREQVPLSTNGTTRPKLEGLLVADVPKRERKVQCFITPTIGTWNVRNMNQGKLKIIK